eukprot:scaffold258453_cov32-Prasinocladus_malaysianus.AAC.2
MGEENVDGRARILDEVDGVLEGKVSDFNLDKTQHATAQSSRASTSHSVESIRIMYDEDQYGGDRPDLDYNQFNHLNG